MNPKDRSYFFRVAVFHLPVYLFPCLPFPYGSKHAGMESL